VTALILWDVDHTLIDSGGVSKEIYAAAFLALTGFPPAEPARTEGRTDRRIMRKMFETHALVVPPWPSIHAALKSAGREHFTRMQQRGSVLSGVRETLAALSQRTNAVQTLLTGNIESNARVKVGALGLADTFDFEVGAYGSDSDDRADLVATAQRRASIKYGTDFNKANTVLIGDTTRDIDAARRGGAQVIAVASGQHTVAQLAAAGADIVLSDLRQIDHLLAELGRLTG